MDININEMHDINVHTPQEVVSSREQEVVSLDLEIFVLNKSYNLITGYSVCPVLFRFWLDILGIHPEFGYVYS